MAHRHLEAGHPRSLHCVRERGNLLSSRHPGWGDLANTEDVDVGNKKVQILIEASFTGSPGVISGVLVTLLSSEKSK